MTDATLLDYWPTPERLDECARADSDAVFLAVRPPVLLRRVTAEGPAEPVGERQFLTEFFRPDPPAGRVLAAIEDGPAAAGLLRWLTLHARRGPGSERRHVVTRAGVAEPRDFLRHILESLPGPGYDALRAELDSPSVLAAPPPSVSPDVLAATLKERVAETRKRLEADPAPARAALDARRRKEPIDPTTQAVLDDIDLIGWLGPGLADWLTTPATNAAVLAALAEGREVREADFRLESLPAGGSAPLRSVVKNFTATDENGGLTARTLAAQVLNELAAAIQPPQPQVRSLADLFDGLRIQLAVDGKELILLGDCAVATFLAVVIPTDVGEGGSGRCIVRAAWPVGLAGADPVGSAAPPFAEEWSVVAEPYVSAPEGLTALTVRVGEYLNAARLGADELASSLVEATDLSGWPPTIDPADRLAPADRDVIEAFGRSAAGRPLFPFSRAVLEQIAGRETSESPSGLLARVLVPILRANRDAFAAGVFPLPTYPEFPLLTPAEPAIAEQLVLPVEPAVPPPPEPPPVEPAAEPEAAPSPPPPDPRLLRAAEWFGITPGFDAEQTRQAMLDAIIAAKFAAPAADLAERVRGIPLAVLAEAVTDPGRPTPDEPVLASAVGLMDDYDDFLARAVGQVLAAIPPGADPAGGAFEVVASAPVRQAREAALASLAEIEAALRGIGEEQP